MKKYRAPLLGLAVLAACLSAFLLVRQIVDPSEELVLESREPVFDLRPESPQMQPGENERYIYPYSVIPGGVASREELVARIADDPVVAAHYANFDVGQARIVKASETRFVHVAYRMQDKVYWTSKKLKIPEGEPLITDGRDTARTRCGNRVSAVPLEPVSEDEPAIETFDIPVLARLEAPELPERRLQMHEFPPIASHIPIQRPKILPYYYRPLFVVRPPSTVVPEPATLGLLAVGLAALVTYRIARKK